MSTPVAAGLAASYALRPSLALGAEFELIRQSARGDYIYHCHEEPRTGCLVDAKAALGFSEWRTTWHSPFNLFARGSFGLGWIERSAVSGYESRIEGIFRASAGGELRSSGAYVRPYALATTFGGREANLGFGFELGAVF